MLTLSFVPHLQPKMTPCLQILETCAPARFSMVELRQNKGSQQSSDGLVAEASKSHYTSSVGSQLALRLSVPLMALMKIALFSELVSRTKLPFYRELVCTQPLWIGCCSLSVTAE